MKKPRPEKIIKANTPSCSSCKKDKNKHLMFDDYKEELMEYQMDLPGSYQGGSVWGGTGNYGFGGKRQIVQQKLNPATQAMADFETDSHLAAQKDLSDEFDEEYIEDKLSDQEEKLLTHNSAIAEAYPTMSLGKGKADTFSNLPGFPRTNTLEKQVDHIPDDFEAEEEQKLDRLEDKWIDHLQQQPKPDNRANKFAQIYAAEFKDDEERIKDNNDTPSNGLGYSSLDNAKRFVPKELDQYSNNKEDILWTIGRRNST